MQQYYKVPNEEQRKAALGSLPGLQYRLRKALESVKDMFSPMDKPIEGQWLWQHEEEGQSYDAYKGQMHNQVDQKRNVIYIKSLQIIEVSFLKELQAFCSQYFYPMKVKIAKSINSLKDVGRRINPYTQKQQFNARDILSVLKKQLPPDAFCLIGVSVTDLYPRDQWNFVFGLASIRQRTGVFSFARYDQRFFGEKPYEIDYNLIKYRSWGVVAHQVTHMFGVRHCIYYKCLMNGSNHLEESSKKPMYQCVVCLRKLQSNIKFDILERYIKLRDFYIAQKDQRVDGTIKFLNSAIAKIEANTKT